MLPPFNLKLNKEQIITDRANLKLPDSAIVIVDSRKDTRLQLRYGMQDQPLAEEIAVIGKNLGEKIFIKPGEKEFVSLCDLVLQLVLQLQPPAIYRKAEAGQREGYLTDMEDIYKVLETAYDKMFTDMFLGSWEKQYDNFDNFKHFNGVDVVFRK